MSSYHFERLSAQDTSFLMFEGPNTHMHVGGTAIYEAGPLQKPNGGVDIDRIRAYINSRLSWIPRYRQRLAFIPLDGSAVWVDDDKFNLAYHVRHTSLPKPGDDEQLKRLSARILSQQLDRGKPLWETWIIEGLKGNRFAMLTKAHHCMIDGASGVDLSTVLMRTDPDDRIDETGEWVPRPAPTGAELLRDELLQRAAAPLDAARGIGRALSDPSRLVGDVSDFFTAARGILGTGLQGAAETPINRPIGPHRRQDWFTQPLADIKFVKNQLGGTINDVVLTTVAGGMRRFFKRRRVNIDNLEYKVAIPVNVRSASERGRLGNRVSAWLATLPIQERDPVVRMAQIHEVTRGLKDSKQALAADMFNQLVELTGSTLLLSLGVMLAGRLNPYNCIVTNVPGPNFPLYLLGSKMLEAYPQVPLFENQGLGIALFSYLDRICWGFNADYEILPDLHDLVEGLQAEFKELQAAARKGPVEIETRSEEPVKKEKPAPVARAKKPAKKRPAASAKRRQASGRGLKRVASAVG